jgi:hypothetical protein
MCCIAIIDVMSRRHCVCADGRRATIRSIDSGSSIEKVRSWVRARGRKGLGIKSIYIIFDAHLLHLLF